MLARMLLAVRFAKLKPITVALDDEPVVSNSIGVVPTSVTTLFLKKFAMFYPNINTTSIAKSVAVAALIAPLEPAADSQLVPLKISNCFTSEL